jgi:hypothetical protein
VEAIMTLYRFCLLDQADRVRALETIECDDGEEAEYLAHEMMDSLGYNAVEVWEGTARIYRAEIRLNGS